MNIVEKQNKVWNEWMMGKTKTKFHRIRLDHFSIIFGTKIKMVLKSVNKMVLKHFVAHFVGI